MVRADRSRLIFAYVDRGAVLARCREARALKQLQGLSLGHQILLQGDQSPNLILFLRLLSCIGGISDRHNLLRFDLLQGLEGPSVPPQVAIQAGQPIHKLRRPHLVGLSQSLQPVQLPDVLLKGFTLAHLVSVGLRSHRQVWVRVAQAADLSHVCLCQAARQLDLSPAHTRYACVVRRPRRSVALHWLADVADAA